MPTPVGIRTFALDLYADVKPKPTANKPPLEFNGFPWNVSEIQKWPRTSWPYSIPKMSDVTRTAMLKAAMSTQLQWKSRNGDDNKYISLAHLMETIPLSHNHNLVHVSLVNGEDNDIKAIDWLYLGLTKDHQADADQANQVKSKHTNVFGRLRDWIIKTKGITKPQRLWIIQNCNANKSPQIMSHLENWWFTHFGVSFTKDSRDCASSSASELSRDELNSVLNLLYIVTDEELVQRVAILKCFYWPNSLRQLLKASGQSLFNLSSSLDSDESEDSPNLANIEELLMPSPKELVNLLIKHAVAKGLVCHKDLNDRTDHKDVNDEIDSNDNDTSFSDIHVTDNNGDSYVLSKSLYAAAKTISQNKEK